MRKYVQRSSRDLSYNMKTIFTFFRPPPALAFLALAAAAALSKHESSPRKPDRTLTIQSWELILLNTKYFAEHKSGEGRHLFWSLFTTDHTSFNVIQISHLQNSPVPERSKPCIPHLEEQGREPGAAAARPRAGGGGRHRLGAGEPLPAVRQPARRRGGGQLRLRWRGRQPRPAAGLQGGQGEGCKLKVSTEIPRMFGKGAY